MKQTLSSQGHTAPMNPQTPSRQEILDALPPLDLLAGTGKPSSPPCSQPNPTPPTSHAPGDQSPTRENLQSLGYVLFLQSPQSSWTAEKRSNAHRRGAPHYNSMLTSFVHQGQSVANLLEASSPLRTTHRQHTHRNQAHMGRITSPMQTK